MEERTKTRGSWDLISIVAFSLLLALIIYLFPDSLLRTIIGLPFILFFPGYALTATLFPERSSLDLVERIALSFGLSIAIVPLLGFGLNYTPFGIRLEPILWSLIAFDVAMSLLGMWRRSSAADPFVPGSPAAILGPLRKELSAGSNVDRALTMILVLAILSSVVALAYVVAVPREGESFTEFYLLGANGRAADYPSNLNVGEKATVTVGIANHENRVVNYSVQVWMVNATFADNVTTVNKLVYLDTFRVVLNSTPASTEGNWTRQWETNYTFALPQTGEYKVWFVLLKDGTTFQGVKYQSYKGTLQEQKFLSNINDKDVLTLNLNVVVSPAAL